MNVLLEWARDLMWTNRLLVPLLGLLVLGGSVLPIHAGPQEFQAAPSRKADRVDDFKRRISRILLIGFNGTGQNGDLARLAAFSGRYPIGGYLLLDRNIRNFEQLRALTKRLDAISPETQIIAVDEEGGHVRRLRRLPEIPAVPSARKITRTNPDTAYKTYAKLAAALDAVGVNLNLGPVADLDINRRNAVIVRLGRSYGSNPHRVVAFANAFTRAHREIGVETALKHFPGHGSTLGDPHHAPVDAVRTWSPRELVPFERAIAYEPPSFVLTSHITIASKTLGQAEPLRATFSKPAIDHLRKNLGFRGLVITDDLTMGAITHDHSLEDAVAKSLIAGHDLVILANTGRNPVARVSKLIDRLAQRALDDPDLAVAVAVSSERVRVFKATRMAANYARSELAGLGEHRQFAVSRPAAPSLTSREQIAAAPGAENPSGR